MVVVVVDVADVAAMEGANFLMIGARTSTHVSAFFATHSKFHFRHPTPDSDY